MYYVYAEANTDQGYRPYCWVCLNDKDFSYTSVTKEINKEIGKNWTITNTDFEGIPHHLLECYSLKALCEIAKLTDKYGLAIQFWLERYQRIPISEETFKHVFIGSYDDMESYAEYWIDSIGGNFIPEQFIDLEGLAKWLLYDFYVRQDNVGKVHVFKP
jgi:antirestriction protein